jgi:hypothetical protein
MQNLSNGYVSKILLRDFLPPISKKEWTDRKTRTTYPPRIVLSSRNKYAVESESFDVFQRLDPIQVSIECKDDKEQRKLSSALKDCIRKNAYIEIETGVLSKGGGDTAFKKKTFSTKSTLHASDLIERFETIAKKPNNNAFPPSKTDIQGFKIHGFDTTYTLIDFTLSPSDYNEEKPYLEVITENYNQDDDGEFKGVSIVSFRIHSNSVDDVNSLCNLLDELSVKKESFVQVTGNLPRQNDDHFVVDVNESCGDLLKILKTDTKEIKA